MHNAEDKRKIKIKNTKHTKSTQNRRQHAAHVESKYNGNGTSTARCKGWREKIVENSFYLLLTLAKVALNHYTVNDKRNIQSDRKSRETLKDTGQKKSIANMAVLFTRDAFPCCFFFCVFDCPLKHLFLCGWEKRMKKTLFTKRFIDCSKAKRTKDSLIERFFYFPLLIKFNSSFWEKEKSSKPIFNSIMTSYREAVVMYQSGLSALDKKQRKPIISENWTGAMRYFFPLLFRRAVWHVRQKLRVKISIWYKVCEFF